IPDASTNWHHVAVTFDFGTNTIYWDGVARGTLEQNLGGSLASAQIGSSRSTPTAEGWVGVIDEVAFYADALSASAIQTHFRAFAAGTPPAITVAPVGGAFVVGNPFQMTVAATGADLEYQWFKDGNPLGGATNVILALPSLSVSDSGEYSVRVSNPAGSTNTPNAVLQVGNYLSAYQAVVAAEPGLISYYTFDAGDARDAKGTNAGVVANMVGFGGGVGLVTNLALILDGTGHIDLGQVPDLDFTNGTGTIEAWIRPDWTSASYAPCLFANRVASTFQVDWSLHMVQAKDAIGSWNGLFFQTLGLVNPGGWHHFAVVFGGGKVTMFWDGQTIGSFGQAINLVTGLPAQIGSSEPGTTQEGWMGAIDEVAFYTSSLEGGAIQKHYLAMVAGVAPSAPALSCSRNGNQLTLSWPAEVQGFALESTDDLTSTSWQTVNGVVNNRVTLDVTGNLRFFRLKK
ncbi:MAG TPA: LamG-like jellyroll fold domain-containing protein, partial [Clostridia bacterium]|nr:LamG-like jellyroll fold domain-containing protein [Clostridia bacterium]